ncbi:hypothetical protein M9H77_34658 [Catharanthus roseus]|uniref:Uncharacterized protein n=1 Tax=Catharanthus roseus TaxID=4058 RepID=A0ACB9ZNM8_CATRO|nr:hypothetical protein M9H77_34658 [Catharanthus roseus]
MEVLLTRSPSYHTVDMSRNRDSLKCRSRYMALTEWDLTDAQVWIYLYFSMFAPAVRPGTEACKPYILQYSMLGYKNENKLLDIRLRLDLMTADEVNGHRTGLRSSGLLGFHVTRAVYSLPPYATSGDTQAAKKQDVRVEEYFCEGTVVRSTFEFIDKVMD